MDEKYHQEALQQAHVDIAVLQTQVATLTRDVAAMGAAIAEMTRTIADMNLTLSEARGGWRFMMALGGAGATFGGFLVWIIEQLLRKPH